MIKSLQIQENVPLAPYTTLGIGGNARLFVRAETEDHVVTAVKFAEENDLQLFVLGGGSNVLIADHGFDGLVLQIAIGGIKTVDPKLSNPKAEIKNSKLIEAGAGEDWDGLVAHCVADDLAGIECLSGIPGLVGGTPVQNVGAYGQEVAETIVEVRCLDRKTQQIVIFSNGECRFSYRSSIFNSTLRDRFIVLSVTFNLRKGGEAKIVYKDLIEHFTGSSPSLSEVREAVLNIRRSKSMVIDAADPNSKSAGSFFKNPVVPTEKLDELRTSFPRMPYFAFGERFKIPAAWLIENTGFEKGYRLVNAGISSNHTLALINRENATAEEMIVLKGMIQEAVEAKFGICLKPEPIFIGF